MAKLVKGDCMAKNRNYGADLAQAAHDAGKKYGKKSLTFNEHKAIQKNAFPKENRYSDSGLKSMLTQKGIPYDNSSSKGGCFITTAVCNSMNLPDDCYELTTFRKFRDTYMMENDDKRNDVSEYYEIAPKICESINKLYNSNAIYRSILCDYLMPVLHEIEAGNNQRAYDLYKMMVLTLRGNYLQ